VSRDAFGLLYFIVQKRLLLGRFTIVDSTALQTDTRLKLLEIAQHYHYNACLLVFNTLATTCIQRDRTRTRKVGEDVIRYHEALLHRVVKDAPQEGWQQIHILAEQEQPVYRIYISEA
jgi:protein phosphatase